LRFTPLELHDGRWLHRRFSELSLDFWPTSPPNIRQFRKLYLVDGRGDFEPQTFARFLRSLLPDNVPRLELERHTAALNIFVSYILGEFYRQNDHWSIFRSYGVSLACARDCGGRHCPDSLLDNEPKRPVATASYSLLPLVLLFVNRAYKSELERHWKAISRIVMTVFLPDEKAGYLEWHCAKGSEKDQAFQQPQSWRELVEFASSPRIDKLPEVLRSDRQFRLMFTLAFPHRQAWSILGSIDQDFRSFNSN